MKTHPRTRLPFPPLPARGPARVGVRSRRRSARAAVLGGLTLMLAAVLGMNVAVETAVPRWRDPEYGHRLRQLRALRAAHPDRPLVVALGSSRTQMGVSPADMGFPDAPGSPVVYNAGRAAAGPLMLHLTLARLLDDGVRPDYLLVEVFPAALAVDGPAEDMVRVEVPRLSAADVRHLGPYCRDPVVLRRAWAGTRANSWYSLRLTLLSHWLPGWLPWPHRQDFMWTRLDRYGWLPYTFEVMPPGMREQGTERARRDYERSLAAYRIGKTPDRALRDLLARSRAADIPTALYPTPEGPAFRSWYAPETRVTVAAYLAGLSREYGVPVFDAADGFGDDEFADSHHLLRSGAARFSRRLAEHVGPWAGAGK